MGFIAVLTNVLFNLAFTYTTVANVLMVLYLSVFWGILFGFLFLKERSLIKKIIYTLLAFLGICLALVKGHNGLALSIGIGELLALITSFVWAMDSVIARKIKQTRDATWVKKDEAGYLVNRTDGIDSLGSAAMDNEECYPLVKMMRALGLVYVEHHARI